VTKIGQNWAVFAFLIILILANSNFDQLF